MKLPKFFVIHFPNGEELLYKARTWTDMTHIVPYITNGHDEDTFLVPLECWDVIKFLLGGRVGRVLTKSTVEAELE